MSGAGRERRKTQGSARELRPYSTTARFSSFQSWRAPRRDHRRRRLPEPPPPSPPSPPLPSPPPPPPVPALARRPRRPQRPPRRRQSRLRVGPSSSLFRRHVRPATAMWVGDMRLVGRKCTPEGLRGTSLKMPLLSRSSILLEIVRLVFSCFATKLANKLRRPFRFGVPQMGRHHSVCRLEGSGQPFSVRV